MTAENQNWFWRLPRPTMIWSSIGLPFLAVGGGFSWPVVLISVGYPLLLYFMRGGIDKGFIERIVSIWKGGSVARNSQ